jgi:uncharacterized protein (DUF305 family)
MKSFLAVLAAMAVALLLSSCGSPTSESPQGSASKSTAAQPAFNQADVDFATMMIPHHQQAVKLSDLVPSRSTNPELISLASAIAAAQGPEIETMKVFLVQWNAGAAGGQERSDSGNGTSHDMSNMSDMQGMVDGATMDKLQTLKGAEFDTLWLQSMIGHHEGAIGMANAELKDGTNADAKKLAKEIVDGQTAEITQMKQMLGG